MIRMTSTVDTTAPVTTGLYIGGKERSTSDALEVVVVLGFDFMAEQGLPVGQDVWEGELDGGEAGF